MKNQEMQKNHSSLKGGWRDMKTKYSVHSWTEVGDGGSQCFKRHHWVIDKTE